MDSNAGCTKDIQIETMCVEEMIGEREREREREAMRKQTWEKVCDNVGTR